MTLRSVSATIRRRILVTYRLDAAVARSLVPPALRLRLVDGYAVAGVCLIGLDAVRPSLLGQGRGRGLASENAAHRIAVEWDGPDGVAPGVFIPRRDSSSWIPVLAGGRVIPGLHGHAAISTSDEPGRIVVDLVSSRVTLHVAVRPGPWRSELFPRLEDASEFYRSGVVGWSPTRSVRRLESLSLTTDRWRVEAAEPIEVRSSYFDGLPSGAAELDSVLLMRDVPVRLETPARASAPARISAA